MKKIVLLLAVIASFIYKVNAQAYVKFAKTPVMELNSSQTQYNYSLVYNALEKSTIYLELKQGDKLVGNSIYDITKAGKKRIAVKLSLLQNIGTLKEGDNYSYDLHMYEGGRNDWSKKACKTIVINGVRVKNKTPRRTISVNTFN